MKNHISDRLGLGDPISRRDFVNGALLASAGLLLHRRGGRVRDSVREKAITAGGESGNVSSPHVNDEAQRYSTGNLRDVYFYPSQLKGHVERVYHPGESN